ncbi:cobalamin biosynthesis protein [Pimelobacter simplex]|uniref:cobalamin biosynthesis protein n=1 Tax=Nocardioides simplex TaxID=2045 RepID=UPI00214FF8A9|nr:cobalamin biosynthesis protein [Pimelobacter simplex]UUW89011.1 cobalamin biosynthesis protein [Pimelobacter simplex]UUW98516.1 cobalamin biosynthesis protein [Pimelobacter simplex]
MSRRRGRRRGTATGLLLGLAADRLLGDPRRGHPVAGFGRAAAALEQRTWRDDRVAGVVHVGVLVGGTVALALAPEQVRRPVPRALLTAAATWAVVGGTSLDREAAEVGRLLAAGDLPAARVQLTHLVGRDTSQLDEAGIVRATLESLAENTSDAVVAPLVWGAIAGIPGLLGYRAANTLDAMVGHRSPRYERFGWAAARFDDLLNLPGARLTAALAVVLGDDPASAWRTWRRDASGHPSPNAGPVEAAFAGALGIHLGGTNDYAGRVEHRAVMGDGPAPTRADLERARVLARRIGLAAGLTAWLTRSSIMGA